MVGEMTDQPQSNRAARPNRRIVLLGGVAAATVAAVYSLSSMVAPATELSLTPDEAHQHATAQEILLIDIRRPDEWDLTGIGQGAVRWICGVTILLQHCVNWPVMILVARSR